MNKWIKVSGTVAMIAAAGVLTVNTVSFAQATDAAPGNDDSSGLLQRGERGERGSRMSLESLGLEEGATQEEIQAAKIAQVQAKVAEGTITQDEADAKIERIESGEKGFGRRGGRGHHGPNLESLGLDADATTEEIQAAMIAQVEAKVADGTVTQEQADMMIERIESGKKGFGHRGGDRMNLESLGLDADATPEEIQAAMIAAVEAKVADGTITQEQADTMIERIESGEKGFGNRGGFRGKFGGFFNGNRGGNEDGSSLQQNLRRLNPFNNSDA